MTSFVSFVVWPFIGEPIHTRLKKHVHHLVEKYRQAVGKDRVDGITLDELAIAEVVFEVNVQVYTLLPAEVNDEDGENEANETTEATEKHFGKSTIQVELVRRSHRRYPDTLYLNLAFPIRISTADPTPVQSATPYLPDRGIL